SSCGYDDGPAEKSRSVGTWRAAATGPATVTTDATSYPFGTTIRVDWSGLPGNQHDWVALSQDGSSDESFVVFVYTNGQVSGSAVFSGLGTGTYVARLFQDNSYTKLAESAAFSVGAGSTAPVTTDKSAYASTDPITVSWAGLPGNPRDWIAI